VKEKIILLLFALAPALAWGQNQFHLQEATIADIHNAIKAGQITCQGVIEAYIARAKAYNGVCTELVTKDGAALAPVKGVVRAGSPVQFPTKTVPVSSVLPNFSEYAGLPMEFGRMEPTVSDPSVKQQFGMRVGIANAGQLNALETLNIRGERSVTCKGEFDKAPSKGQLPPGAPAACEEFRKLPDALERAAELDKQYGRNPDLVNLPMYCAVFSIKNWYDAKDMRSTGGNDINYAMDVPRLDSPDVADLRTKGAIIYAVATAKATGIGDGNNFGGGSNGSSVLLDGNMGMGVWGGQTCNPYDTERVPRGTSNGSGVSVAANLVMCSICEQTSASCKGPASRNNVVNLLTTKGILMDGGPGHSNAGDRAGIHCRTVGDAVSVLDAVKGFDSTDLFSAIPPGLIPKEPYTSFLVDPKAVPDRPLQGMRIGVVREFMVKHTKNDEAISDQLDQEIKTVLREKLGAELVESVDPLYADDPAVANMKYTFEDALRQILPATAPEFLQQTTSSGELEFAVPGWDVKSTDYLVALSLGKAPLSDKLNLRRLAAGNYSNSGGAFAMNLYLAERGDARVKNQASLTANAKSERLSPKPGVITVPRENRRAQSAISYMKMQAVMRMVIQKVMSENRIDTFVNPEQTTPPYKLGGPGEPAINDRPAASCCMGFTALIGGPEIDVPAGYNQTVYEPQYVLSEDKKQYLEVTGSVKSVLPYPMPVSLMFWAAPGNEPALIKVASAYEAATHHRVPPPSFGPVAGEP
jgi:Asp-tRNA(Asn)/Glu-tRNA(Gln) amidotransferase A subunit family amidase